MERPSELAKLFGASRHRYGREVDMYSTGITLIFAI